jgi:hypothetical protein
VATLRSLPSGLTRHAFGYIPATPPGSRLVPGIIALDRSAQDTIRDVPQTGPAVWLRFTALAPGTQYVEIIEQPAKAAPAIAMGTGLPLTINGVPATARQERNQTTITLAQFGTAVTIRTNMGRDQAVNEVTDLSWR